MTFTILAASLMALQAAPEVKAETQPEAKSGSEVEVVEERVVKITDKAHPDYIRCKRESIIGSRARKLKVCKTNKEWVADARNGNQHSRELIEVNSPGYTTGG